MRNVLEFSSKATLRNLLPPSPTSFAPVLRAQLHVSYTRLLPADGGTLSQQNGHTDDSHSFESTLPALASK